MRKMAGISLLALGLVSAASAADQGDYPGKHFSVSPTDLAKPFATPATDNSSQTIPRPAGVVPAAPKGFTVSVYASGLSNPRWMAVAPNGDVFLAEPDANKVTILRGTDKATTVETFASGFKRPHGLAFHDGALYVGEHTTGHLLRYDPAHADRGLEDLGVIGGEHATFPTGITESPYGAIWIGDRQRTAERVRALTGAKCSVLS